MFRISFFCPHFSGYSYVFDNIAPESRRLHKKTSNTPCIFVRIIDDHPSIG